SVTTAGGNSTLTLQESSGTSLALNLGSGQNFSGDIFDLTPDGHGGTNVSIHFDPAPVTIAFRGFIGTVADNHIDEELTGYVTYSPTPIFVDYGPGVPDYNFLVTDFQLSAADRPTFEETNIGGSIVNSFYLGGLDEVPFTGHLEAMFPRDLV